MNIWYRLFGIYHETKLSPPFFLKIDEHNILWYDENTYLNDDGMVRDSRIDDLIVGIAYTLLILLCITMLKYIGAE